MQFQAGQHTPDLLVLQLVDVEVQPLLVLHRGDEAAVRERGDPRDRAVEAVALDDPQAVDDEQRRAGGPARDGRDGEAAVEAGHRGAARAGLRKVAGAVQVEAGHGDGGEDGLRAVPVHHLAQQQSVKGGVATRPLPDCQINMDSFRRILKRIFPVSNEWNCMPMGQTTWQPPTGNCTQVTGPGACLANSGCLFIHCFGHAGMTMMC